MTKSNLTAWQRWELAALDDGTPPKQPPLRSRSSVVEEQPPAAPPVHMPTAEEVEQIHRQAHDSGYQEGRAEGLRLGQQEGRESGLKEGKALGEEAARHLLTVATKLDTTLTELDEAVAEELTALALEIAREVLRQTLSLQPETVVGVVRDALTKLPHQHANIYLHPDDASLVRSYAGDQLSHAGHRIHEDPRLQRNDVTIEAGGAHVDATLSTRWRRVVETLGQSVPWDGKPLLPPMPAPMPVPMTPPSARPDVQPDTQADAPPVDEPAQSPPPVASMEAELAPAAAVESVASADGPTTQDVIASITDDASPQLQPPVAATPALDEESDLP